MKIKTITIADDVANVLSYSAEISGNQLRLTGQLDRDLYVRTNKVLEALGGKWHRKQRAHLFERDPRDAIAEALGNGAAVNEKQTFGQFNTPADLAERVIDAADIRPGHRVLEPSAGTGALLQALWDSDAHGDVVAVEINRDLCNAMWEKFPGIDLYCLDFLSCRQPDGHSLGPQGEFDRIIMNPPFADGQDIRHITHALSFLTPGGRLVAIMSAGVTFRQDRLATEFRKMVDERGGTIEPLPDDAFKEAGTGVRTVMVTIDAAPACDETLPSSASVENGGMRTERTTQGQQTILPGTERSARQAAAAREANGHGKIRARKPQREPGGMFAAQEPEQPKLF